MTDKIRKAGTILSNIAFNFAQKCGHTLTSDDCSLLDKARKDFDAAVLSTPASQSAEDDRAAKMLALCMDYPWEYMPEQGRQRMREHVARIVSAALQEKKQC